LCCCDGLFALSVQRYSKMPVIGDSFGASTCIAFDLMSVNLADLPALPRLVPALKVSNACPSANLLVPTLEVDELLMHRSVSCLVACRTDKQDPSAQLPP
jgi:hypothetical protein